MPDTINILETAEKFNFSSEEKIILSAMMKAINHDRSQTRNEIKKVDRKLILKIVVCHTLNCDKEDCMCRVVKQRASRIIKRKKIKFSNK
jgi:hypothetical protein